VLAQVQARQRALRQLGQLYRQHADAGLFQSLPGSGDLLGPALLAKFGDQRARFASPHEVQALAGTCPVTEQSGKRKCVVFRYGCDKEFRRIAQHFALASLSQSTWASAYWYDVRPRCASESHALRCLANRWLAIIWKLWQTRQPYDEAYHLRQRAQRSRPKA
jgi:transposase